MVGGLREQVFGKEFLQGWDQESCGQGLKCFSSTHESNGSLRVCATPLQRPLLREERVPASPSPWAELQLSSREPRRLEGTRCSVKLLLQCRGTDEEGNVRHSSCPALRSHHFAVARCLFSSAACPGMPSETCRRLNVAEQHFCPRAAS